MSAPAPDPIGDAGEFMWDAFADLFPARTGFDAQYLFDDLFSSQV